MKIFNKLMCVLFLVQGIVFAKTLSVNDQIMHWTPKMIEYITTAGDMAQDPDQKQEAHMLLIEWNSFKNNLSARKSNQKVFLKTSKKSEALLKRIQTSLGDDCKEQRKIQRMLDNVYVGQNKVRGKK